jgi:hypothetical protein
MRGWWAAIAERSGKRSRLNRDPKVVSGSHQAKYLSQDLATSGRFFAKEKST